VKLCLTFQLLYFISVSLYLFARCYSLPVTFEADGFMFDLSALARNASSPWSITYRNSTGDWTFYFDLFVNLQSRFGPLRIPFAYPHPYCCSFIEHFPACLSHVPVRVLQINSSSQRCTEIANGDPSRVFFNEESHVLELHYGGGEYCVSASQNRQVWKVNERKGFESCSMPSLS